jgi:1-acyl-sn-glycerol-3-phosphate acyltransferase
MQVLAFIHTLFSRFLLLLIMIVCFIPAVIFLFILPSRYRYDSKGYYWFAHFFYNALLKATLLPITFKGKENMPSDPAIIIANHQSSLDIPLVGSLLNCHPHIWLATIDLLSSPILRFIIPRVTVLIDMSTPMKGMRSLIKAIEMIDDERRHVVLFPEGSRYDDGNIHDFYAGFVILAKKTERPVVPIRIFGANKVYPRDAFIMHNYPIKVVIGKPMLMGHDESDEAFMARVHQWFIDQKEY